MVAYVPSFSIPPGPTSMRDVQERRKEVCLPDGVTGSQADPLRDRTVLLLGFGKLLLGAEGLLALLDDEFVSPLQLATL